jgi:DNA-binding MarR family transcriptional regulator
MTDQYSPPKRTELESLLTFRLARFYAALNRQSIKLLRKAGNLNIPAWRIISFLAANGAMTGRQLAEASGLDTGLTSRCLQDLAGRGLVVCERRDEDRRAVWAQLTEEGRRLEAKVRPVMRARHQRMISVLGEDERRAFYDMLERLREAVSER